MVVTRRKPKRSKRAPVQLTVAEHERVRAMLTARLVCSAAWAEEVLRAIDAGRVDLFVTEQGELKADFAKVEKVLRRAGAYPPGGLLTVAWRCSKCRRWTPATGFQKRPEDGDTCEDCWIYEQPPHVVAQWPSSPFAVAMAHIRACKLRVRQGRL